MTHIKHILYEGTHIVNYTNKIMLVGILPRHKHKFHPGFTSLDGRVLCFTAIRFSCYFKNILIYAGYTNYDNNLSINKEAAYD